MTPIKLGNKPVGPGNPTYIIAEIGINHNGSMDVVKKLVDGCVKAGCDAVKFQKRTPEICVPKDQWNIERDTPWGRMTYIDYRYKVEFDKDGYAEIDRYCKEKGIQWFTSCWDEQAVDFCEQFDVPAYKVASASVTDHGLLKKYRETGKPVIMSSGMSTMEEITNAVEVLGTDNLILMHATSTYPCKPEELNLKMIHTLQEKFPGVPVGYSGHEVGLATTLAAVSMGACIVERHVTLDRAMWGSDQAASLEMPGVERLVRDVRDIELAFGDGVKKVYESEMGPREKLRRVK